MPFDSDRVLIVGAGLSGLACGVRLAEQGISFHMLEATDQAGGGIQTDVVDGLRLDRGFQAILTESPVCRDLLDYESLDLQPIDRGIQIRYKGQFHPLYDPWRPPALLASNSAISDSFTQAQRLPFARFRRACLRGDLNLTRLFDSRRPSPTSFLEQLGFSVDFIETFFVPFIACAGGELQSDSGSRFLFFLFRMLFQGNAAIPAKGMGAITDQLLGRLPPEALQLEQTVTQVEEGSVLTSDGQTHHYDQLILANGSSAAARLLPAASIDTRWHSESCLYFVCDQAPILTSHLMLNGDGQGPINHVSVLSQCVPQSAPQKATLIGATLANCPEDFDQTEKQVWDQLREWYGDQVDTWRLVRSYQSSSQYPKSPRNDEWTSEPEIHRIGNHQIFLCRKDPTTPLIHGSLACGVSTAAFLQKIEKVKH